MQLNVTGHHVEVTAALRGYVEKKLERIVRHFDQVIDVHCVLTVEKLRQKAEATLHVSGSAITRSLRSQHVCGHRRADRQARPLRQEAQGKEMRPSRDRSAALRSQYCIPVEPPAGAVIMTAPASAVQAFNRPRPGRSLVSSGKRY